jgi:hypothetical protein
LGAQDERPQTAGQLPTEQQKDQEPHMRNHRALTPQQLLKWAEHNRDIMRLRTDRDILPGGYMAAFAPVLVAWQESELRDDGGYVVLRNVNYGGNPLERTTVLQSARVPLDGIEAAEFMLVPLDARGVTQHAEIRFIFAPQCSPQLLNLAGAQTGSVASLPDLIFSWEAWRPPHMKFSLRQGLDESTYALTLRAFAGPQLYLEDRLREHDWFSYRLRMPGGRIGLQELLKVVLALGDGVARHTIRRMLQQDEQTWLAHAPAGQAQSLQDAQTWQALEARLADAAPQSVGAQDLPESQQTYHALVRSCATLARHAVLLATERLIDRGHTDGVHLSRLPDAELPPVEDWMKALAHADLRSVFLSAPAALRFLARHPQAIPTRIPEQLDAAGLLVRRNGKPWVIHYGRKATRPYGATGLTTVD